MKSILLLLIISIIVSIQANAQREIQGNGRDQESTRIERIDRNQDRIKPTKNPKRKIIEIPETPIDTHTRIISKEKRSTAFCGDVVICCPINSPTCKDVVYNSNRLSPEQLAYQFFDSEDLGNALLNVNTAIENDLFNPDLYFLRGKIYFELNDYIQAKTDFLTVIVYDPQFADAHYYNGMCNLFLGNQQLAKKDFEVAASLGDPVAEKLLHKYFQ